MNYPVTVFKVWKWKIRMIFDMLSKIENGNENWKLKIGNNVFYITNKSSLKLENEKWK